MAQPKAEGKKLFVLDTNILLHDPTSIFRFKEHDIFIPMKVLEELDTFKKGVSEIERNARQTSRFLAELLENPNVKNIAQGISLQIISKTKGNGTSLDPKGLLFFQTNEEAAALPSHLPGTNPDNSILAVVLALKPQKPQYTQIVLVSKDINLRIKANLLNIVAEDYYNDKVIDDINLLYHGKLKLPDNFWETHSKNLDSWQDKGHTFYRITGDDIHNWMPNQFIYLEDEKNFSAIVRKIEIDHAIIEVIKMFDDEKHSVWGIQARNREQNFALNLLMDPDIDFVSLQGIAGTGKTLLALAAGLAQTMEQKIYREIIMTRVTVPLGEDIGFLPGTEEEKMTPWMGALMDNLEVLQCVDDTQDWQQLATMDLIKHRIKIRSLNFMRGRTFLNKYIIIDEAQNLTSKQMKTLITRAGPGTKVVCLGDIKQIDTPYLTETTSGLTYVVDRFKSWEHAGHITLMRGERSRLADFAADNL